MREIKFRAWNVATKTMIDLRAITPLILNMDTDGLFIPFSDGLIIMQFTGLKDKHGAEIYEGDIYEWTDNSGVDRIDTVAWSDSGGWILTDIWWVAEVSGKVIGNIYENPELCQLKEGK